MEIIFFTKLGNIFFKLSITDILYTFVIGKTKSAQKLKLKEKKFGFCVELPIKARLKKMKISTSKSHERRRYSGTKKSMLLKMVMKTIKILGIILLNLFCGELSLLYVF